jgi:hypothetical protein
MPEALKYVIDAAVGLALFAALLVVFTVDLLYFGKATTINTDLENVTVIPVGAARETKKLRLAVTPTASSFHEGHQQKWDDMGKLLHELGDGYKFDEITEKQIVGEQVRLQDYDVVFLTCAHAGSDAMRDRLRNYVAEGGILYASDWRYDDIAAAFPDVKAEALIGQGDKQTLEAEVVDAALRDRLKSPKITLRFDMPEWKTAAFGGPRVKVLLQGSYMRMNNALRATAPLMVKFTFDKGTVFFTSFHNEKQNSDVEKELLQYLVFSLVLAGIDAEINAQMEQHGFKSQPSNLLSTQGKKTTEPKHYENITQGATLRFVLGFRNEGATLSFNIKSPSGKQYTWQGKSTVILDVANAEKGRWTYTVSEEVAAYANFPFTVTVGEKK